MSQQSMFDTNQYGRTRPSEETRNASYEAIQGDLSQQQREYLDILRKVNKYGFSRKGTGTFYTLTDKEAARMLGWERSTVNGRRNEVCGGSGSSEQIKKQPLVVSAGKRPCTESGNTCTAWKPVRGLFD